MPDSVSLEAVEWPSRGLTAPAVVDDKTTDWAREPDARRRALDFDGAAEGRPSGRAPSVRASSDRTSSDRATSDCAPSDRAPSDRAPSDRATSGRRFLVRPSSARASASCTGPRPALERDLRRTLDMVATGTKRPLSDPSTGRRSRFPVLQAWPVMRPVCRQGVSKGP